MPQSVDFSTSSKALIQTLNLSWLAWAIKYWESNLSETGFTISDYHSTVSQAPTAVIRKNVFTLGKAADFTFCLLAPHPTFAHSRIPPFDGYAYAIFNRQSTIELPTLGGKTLSTWQKERYAISKPSAG
ncbi:hypothetical protein MMC29_005498 [Sticta canariensis]|nr:hypothetical protein [Sticta canariensis]